MSKIHRKVCSRCKIEQEHTSFYTRKTGAGTVRPTSWCKDCHKTKEYREAANARSKKYDRKTRATYYAEDPIKYLWSIAKKRASKNNLEFNILPEDIIFTGYCPVSGLKLNCGTNKIDTSLSLDRVDNTKGYVKGNVVAISRWANLKKSDMTLDDLKKLTKYIEEYSS